MKSRRQSESSRLCAQRVEHWLEQVQSLDINADRETGQQNPARAAGDIQYRAIRLAGQCHVEIQPVGNVFEYQIVCVTIIKD